MDYQTYVHESDKTDLSLLQYSRVLLQFYSSIFSLQGENAPIDLAFPALSTKFSGLQAGIKTSSSIAEEIKQRMFRDTVKQSPPPTSDLPAYRDGEFLMIQGLHGLVGLFSELEELLTAFSAFARLTVGNSSVLHPPTPEWEAAKQHLKEEIGDMHWYLARLASCICEEDDVLEANIRKLQARHGERLSQATVDPADGNRDLEAESEALARDPKTPNYYSATRMSPWEAFDAGLLTADERLGYHKGDAIAYIVRAGRKPGEDSTRDIDKAIHHLQEMKKAIKAKEQEQNAGNDH